jgi:serine/threonine protein kinase
MPAAPETKATDQFGPYELYERLGLGGMATVHRAKKHGIEGFERIVALKRMLSHLAEDASFVESFIREAKVASLLQHPNIAQIYDFGRISGVYYIAMELVSGFDVRKLLRYANKANESIPLAVVLSILGELCDALEYAHGFVDEQGTHLQIVHRDISPSNLIVAHTGHVKVIDFGIAKASSRQLHTESGLVKGKLGYMSPEAALGIPLTPVADVFSVGVVAWELVTASPLFSSRTDFETMRRIREADIVPPSRHNPSCPPELDRVILNALERDPDRRLPSAGAFRTALDNIAQRAGVQATARSVAEWCSQYTQPSDSWAGSSPSGRKLPLPPANEPLTAFQKPSRTSSRLKRSTEDIKLAAEIWGDEIATSAARAPLPDFSHQVGTASQLSVPVSPSANLPTVALPPSALPSSRNLMPVVEQPYLAPPPVRPARKKGPIIVAIVLAGITAFLAAYLVLRPKRAPTQAPTTAAITFVVEPPGAVVTVEGKELGHTSPLVAELAEGVHSVSARQDGYKGWASSVAVRAGEAQTIQIALDKEPEQVATTKPPPPTELEPSRPDPTPTPTPAATPVPTPAPPSGKPPKKGGKSPREPEVRRDPTPEPSPEVAKPDPKPDPTPPPKPDPTPVPVPVPAPPKAPARTPVVAATAVSKLSGDLPTIKAAGTDSNGDVLVKMCIDERGNVASVKIVKSTADVAAQLVPALQGWRYKPYLNAEQKASPVCFALSLRLVFKHAD